MYRIAIVGTLLMLLIFTVGCKDDSVVEDPNVSVEKEFRILPWETLEDNTRSFQINIETILTESCENTLIDLIPFFGNNEISLAIRNIPTPDCVAPIFPAISNNTYGDLPLLSYDLEISLKDVIYNKGTLHVNEKYYEFQMDSSDGILIPNARLYKVPTNSIWGYAAYSDIANQNIANEFINDIEDVASSEEYEDGYYGYFSIENDKLSILGEDISEEFEKTFGLGFSGDNVLLTDILSNYRNQYPDLVFKVFTSKGEEL